ncbi:ABC transporter ATP-binding protein [Fusibacter bizertensis]|uniref:ABC transporter ATP-binding protein n=1 Tax=Fusibacter bizertensis TaxID=1488331 RepID=A0ABT6NHG9_9FIRM|nr:ABC transporter ATP-binding protein [Fusibacter bizertensis]MDH8679874.1 ABC transporter ATP-binding protein [Fusibacter bizertensis]
MKQKTHTSPPPHSIWNNYQFASRIYHEGIGKRYHLHDVIAILLGALSPFIAMAFPSFAVSLLQSDTPIEFIVVLIIGYVLLMKGLSVAKAYIDNIQLMNYFFGRIKAADPMRQHLLNMNFEALESKEGQEKVRAADECIYHGNERGIEAFLVQFPKVVLNTLGFSLYSFIVIKINIWLFAFMFFTAVAFSVLSLMQGGYWNKIYKRFTGLYMRRKKSFQETMAAEARGDIILYQMKDWLCRKLYDIADTYEKVFRKYYKLETQTNLLILFINFLRDGVVYYVLIRQMILGQINVSSLLLMIGVVAGYGTWMQQLLNALQEISANTHTVTQFRDFLDYGNEPDNAIKEIQLDKGVHEIKLENVSYRYYGATENVISGVTLTIKAGEKVALVGANGAGKTTLVKLICGLYQPTGGRITINGIDTTKISREQYYKAFSVVFQDLKVYAATIAQNVSCTLVPNRDIVNESLRKAGLWEKIASLSNGIDSDLTHNLSEKGVLLSGGETQKLMLARAIYQDSPILILDEPTAALDPIAESEMYEAYSAFTTGKTSLFISHRLSSTRFCDKVCFMKDGKLSEIGTHDTLLELKGDYAQMFMVQSQYYKESFDLKKEVLNDV